MDFSAKEFVIKSTEKSNCLSGRKRVCKLTAKRTNEVTGHVIR